MAIKKDELKEAAMEGFKAEIHKWETTVKEAIKSTEMELLSGTDDIFKTAGWLNFGLSAVTGLAPATDIAKIISNHSVHVCGANALVSGLHELYKKHAKDMNALLKKDHGEIKTELRSGVEKLSILITESDLGKKIFDQILDTASRRMGEAEMTKSKAEAYSRLLIVDAELLRSTKAGEEIETKVQTHITNISKKLLNLYEGSRYGWGQDTLYLADYNKMILKGTHKDYFSGETKAYSPTYNVISSGYQYKGEHGCHRSNTTHNSKAFADLLANVWKYEVKFRNMPLSPNDYAYARINPNAKTAIEVMKEALKSNLEGSKKKLLEVEPKAWQDAVKAF